MAGDAGLSPSPAEAAARSPCRGTDVLENRLVLSARGRISIRRETCKAARTVVARFAGLCVGAYTSQGSCRIRTRKRWLCTSTIVGSAAQGAPSRVKCAARRSRIQFTIKVDLSTIERPPDQAVARVAQGGPNNEQLNCIDSNAASQVVPPPAPPNTFAIHVWGSLPLLAGEGIQRQLLSHRVAKRLIDGLGVTPRNYPRLVPVFLVNGTQEGITSDFCDGSANDAVVAAIGGSVAEGAEVVAHELFHAHSGRIAPRGAYPWFEDLGAEWSTWKAGLLKTPTEFEVFLQFPNRAPDTLDPDGYRYGMWRFLQFLDDRQLVVAGGGSWPLIRSVVSSPPAAGTATLNQFLVSRGTSLGAELAAFWGEHLKVRPQRPPHIKPVVRNSSRVDIRPGQDTYTVASQPLHTNLIEFRLTDSVKRVEFEFEPPADSYFWGLTAPNESREFKHGESVSFCVGAEHDEDLKWPGHFPVTFTNGIVSANSLLGTVKIHAQSDAEHCGQPTNRACLVLSSAGARGLLGPDLPDIPGFAGHDGVTHGRPYTECAYKGFGGVGFLQIQRWSSSRQVRRWMARKAHSPGWRPVRFGDAALIFEAPVGGHVFVQVALGRQLLTVEATVEGGATSTALRLTEGAIREIG
jgi:hypothetical protein